MTDFSNFVETNARGCRRAGRKISNLDEFNIDLDQIESAESEFLGPETRFEGNKRNKIGNIDFKV